MIRWPIGAWPRLRLARRARLADRGFAVTYGPASFHALHLHEYEARLRLGDVELPLKPGDITWTPAHVRSQYDLREPGYHLVLHFHEDAAHERLLNEADEGCIELPLHLPADRPRTYARQQFNEIVHLHALAHHRARYQAVAAHLTQSLLLWLGTGARSIEPGAGAGRAGAAVRWAAEVVDRHLHRPLTVPQIAEEVGLSQNYLARCFRQHFGMTLPRYLLTRRIEVARELLETTALPIQQVAQRVGMPDPHHFNKQFRALTGLSPTAFRDRVRA